MIVVIIKFIDNISSKNISIVLFLNIFLIKIDNIYFYFI